MDPGARGTGATRAASGSVGFVERERPWGSVGEGLFVPDTATKPMFGVHVVKQLRGVAVECYEVRA